MLLNENLGPITKGRKNGQVDYHLRQPDGMAYKSYTLTDIPFDIR